MTWTTLQLQTITPLFSGDDPEHQRADSLIRVPAVRGVLRYWFRAVAAGHGITRLKDLWTEEESVFGSTKKPSPIALRIRTQPRTIGAAASSPEWAVHPDPRRFHGAQYLLGQGLWKRNKGLTRRHVPADEPFELDVRFSNNGDVDARFMLALWAWLSYGGLGARTRRGFGQLRCTGVTAAPLPAGWSPTDLAPPTPDGWQERGRHALPAAIAARVPSDWPPMLGGDPDDDEPLPDIPSLTPRWWEGLLIDGTSRTLGAALDAAGRDWRTYRANTGTSTEPGPTLRSPEWQHVIHGTDQRYPVAALGLPVGYFSPARGERPAFSATVTPYHDGIQLRRASPVWIRPVPVPGGWRTFTHVFWCRLLPPGSELRVTGGVKRDLPVPDDTLIKQAWDNWAGRNHRLPSGFYPDS
jgi:CRISPR type III-B/RAMP module RAMP protein Cmr1